MLLQIIIGALFAPSVLKGFGIDLTGADVTNGVSGAAAAQNATPAQGGQPEPSKPPTTAETINDAVNKPSSLFGIAAIGFVAVFVIAQVRAGTHEAVETSRISTARGAVPAARWPMRTAVRRTSAGGPGADELQGRGG
ncbi:hypothetical protein ACFQDE_16310, partial [Deinococcus caeni]|uniref:hypothetical protein n=1 Tax=Deinococcus caeni TaxID=569127 RepID=UPI003617C709